jgi:hypothetical protein
MGHTVKGSHNNYKPQDPKFYRKVYEEKAIPNLRLEFKHQGETEHPITEQAKEIEAMRKELDRYKQREAEMTKKTDALEALLKRVEEHEKETWQDLMSSALHSLPNAFFVLARTESSYLDA